MLYVYQLDWRGVESGSIRFFFRELLSQQTNVRLDSFLWEFSSPCRLTDQDLYDHCNCYWLLPEKDGQKMLENFNNLPIERAE